MKNLKTLIGIIILLIMMASCSNDSSSITSKMRIIGKLPTQIQQKRIQLYHLLRVE